MSLIDENQRSPLDDWTRYGVRLPMFLGGGMLLTALAAVVLSFTGHVNSVAIPIGVSLSSLGICLLVNAFFKMDSLKCEDAAKYFKSKLIQIQWAEDVKKDNEILELATRVPEEDIQPAFRIFMQAVREQITISRINQELAMKGKCSVPNLHFPNSFPKAAPKHECLDEPDFGFPSTNFTKSNSRSHCISMPNIGTVTEAKTVSGSQRIRLPNEAIPLIFIKELSNRECNSGEYTEKFPC